MSSFPKTINVIEQNYAIEYDESLKNALGQCDGNTLKISILPNQSANVEADVLMHEVIHAIEMAMYLNMSERQVFCISVGLLAVLKRNPQFLEYLNKVINNE